jgi:hypothetical protein
VGAVEAGESFRDLGRALATHPDCVRAVVARRGGIAAARAAGAEPRGARGHFAGARGERLGARDRAPARAPRLDH